MTTAIVVYQAPSLAIVPIGKPETRMTARREAALGKISTIIGTNAPIQIAPTSVTQPEPEVEIERFAMGERLAFANNRIKELSAEVRRDLGDVLADFVDFAVSYLLGDGFNHVALGNKAVDTSAAIRRIGREACGHDRRNYPTPENTPNSDRLAMLREKLSGAQYGPKWNETGKQETAVKLRKLVKHLLGIDLPEDLPVANSRVIYDGWLYRLVPTHTDAMTLQIERLMPAGWRGNRAPAWWPISRYFSWNDGQWCRQSVANIERVYQETVAKMNGASHVQQ